MEGKGIGITAGQELESMSVRMRREVVGLTKKAGVAWEGGDDKSHCPVLSSLQLPHSEGELDHRQYKQSLPKLFPVPLEQSRGLAKALKLKHS